VDRAAELGDTAVIDYVGLKDNVPFAGGTAQDYSLELGSNTFIPGFEDGVVGMAAGDVKDIELSFPETYHAEELAGAAVVFQVKCKEVKAKQPPVLDDEFAKDVSEFDTMAEFRASLKEKVIDRNMQQSEAQFRQALLGQLCDQIEIELPAAMVETQVDRFVDNYTARLEQQGISMDMYMQYMNIDMAKIREDLREPAILQTKQQLALDAVAAAEGIVITDEDVEAEVKKAAANLGVPYERVSEGLDRENLKKDLARDRAMAVVAENAKAKLVEVADNGEIEIKEITKEEVEAEKAEEKPKKKTTRKKKTETEEVKEEKVEE
jgi:trigger factor